MLEQRQGNQFGQLKNPCGFSTKFSFAASIRNNILTSLKTTND